MLFSIYFTPERHFRQFSPRDNIFDPFCPGMSLSTVSSGGIFLLVSPKDVILTRFVRWCYFRLHFFYDIIFLPVLSLECHFRLFSSLNIIFVSLVSPMGVVFDSFHLGTTTSTTFAPGRYFWPISSWDVIFEQFHHYFRSFSHRRHCPLFPFRNVIFVPFFRDVTLYSFLLGTTFSTSFIAGRNFRPLSLGMTISTCLASKMLFRLFSS